MPKAALSEAMRPQGSGPPSLIAICRENPGARLTVMLSIRFHRWAIAALTVSALALPGHVQAQTPDHLVQAIDRAAQEYASRQAAE